MCFWPKSWSEDISHARTKLLHYERGKLFNGRVTKGVLGFNDGECSWRLRAFEKWQCGPMGCELIIVRAFRTYYFRGELRGQRFTAGCLESFGVCRKDGIDKLKNQVVCKRMTEGEG